MPGKLHQCLPKARGVVAVVLQQDHDEDPLGESHHPEAVGSHGEERSRQHGPEHRPAEGEKLEQLAQLARQHVVAVGMANPSGQHGGRGMDVICQEVVGVRRENHPRRQVDNHQEATPAHAKALVKSPVQRRPRRNPGPADTQGDAGEGNVGVEAAPEAVPSVEGHGDQCREDQYVEGPEGDGEGGAGLVFRGKDEHLGSGAPG